MSLIKDREPKDLVNVIAQKVSTSEKNVSYLRLQTMVVNIAATTLLSSKTNVTRYGVAACGKNVSGDPAHQRQT